MILVDNCCHDIYLWALWTCVMAFATACRAERVWEMRDEPDLTKQVLFHTERRAKPNHFLLLHKLHRIPVFLIFFGGGGYFAKFIRKFWKYFGHISGIYWHPSKNFFFNFEIFCENFWSLIILISRIFYRNMAKFLG